MLEVKGFKAFRFSTEKVTDLDRAITPPFDVISPAQRKTLADRSPYNMTHLILPEASGDLDPYQNAARTLDSWIADGVQVQDHEESFYLLEQCFTDKQGNRLKRRGFFALAKIPEPTESYVLGHEKTFRRKIEDRLALTRATEANLGPLLMLYADPQSRLDSFLGEMDRREPDFTARTFDGVEQRVWATPATNTVSEFFRDQKLYIADGHHRFATAVAYRDEKRKSDPSATLGPSDYVLMGFVEIRDPGLKVYPAHRVLDPPEDFSFSKFKAELERHFEITRVEGSLVDRMSNPNGTTFGMAVHGEGFFALTYKDIDREDFLGSDHGPAWRDLDVALLHRGIFDRILGLSDDTEFVYEPDETEALAAWERQEKGLAFLMKGVTPEQIIACADAGEFMPQKATYLFPKLPTGAVIHRLK